MGIALVHGHGMGYLKLWSDQASVASLSHFVEFFFTLSGFILAYNYRVLSTAAARRTFLIHRIARLAPLYYLCGFASLAVPGLNNLTDNPLLPIGAYLFFLQDWFQPTLVLDCFDPTAHSLSSEVFYYMTFLCLASLPRRLEILAFLLVAAALTVFYPPFDPPPPFFNLPLLCGIYFPVGVIAGRLFANTAGAVNAAQKRSLWQTVLFTFLEIVLWLPVSGIAYKISGASSFPLVPSLSPGVLLLLLALFFASIIFVYSLEFGLVSKVLKAKWLTVLGDSSFAIFLLHYPIFVLFMTLLPNSGSRFGWPILVLIVALSILVYFFIEAPCRKLLVDVLTKRSVPDFKFWLQASLRLGLPALMVIAMLCINPPISTRTLAASSNSPAVKSEQWSDTANGVNLLQGAVLFGDLEMLGVKLRRVGADQELLILWRDSKDTFKTGYQITHLVDAKGLILKNLDHLLSKGSGNFRQTDAHTWVDTVILPGRELGRANANAVALAVCFDTRCILLPISSKTNQVLDLNSGRLLIRLEKFR